MSPWYSWRMCLHSLCLQLRGVRASQHLNLKGHTPHSSNSLTHLFGRPFYKRCQEGPTGQERCRDMLIPWNNSWYINKSVQHVNVEDIKYRSQEFSKSTFSIVFKFSSQLCKIVPGSIGWYLSRNIWIWKLLLLSCSQIFLLCVEFCQNLLKMIKYDVHIQHW